MRDVPGGHGSEYVCPLHAQLYPDCPLGIYITANTDVDCCVDCVRSRPTLTLRMSNSGSKRDNNGMVSAMTFEGSDRDH